MDNLSEMKHNRTLQRLRSNDPTLTNLIYHHDPKLTKVSDFSDSLKNNTRLKTLTIVGQPMGNRGLKILCKGLLVNSSIEELILKNNKIGVSGCKFLSEVLAKNQTLNKIDLSCNKIGDNGSIHIINGLKENYFLGHLNLDYCMIKEKGMKFLARALGKNHIYIEELSILSKNMTAPNVKILARSFKRNIYLSSVEGVPNTDKYFTKDFINKKKKKWLRKTDISDMLIPSTYV